MGQSWVLFWCCFFVKHVAMVIDVNDGGFNWIKFHSIWSDILAFSFQIGILFQLLCHLMCIIWSELLGQWWYCLSVSFSIPIKLCLDFFFFFLCVCGSWVLILGIILWLIIVFVGYHLLRINGLHFAFSTLFQVALLLLVALSNAVRVNGDGGQCGSNPTLDPRPHSVSILEFGAVGDGKTLNTIAFQNAIFYLKSFADKGGAQLYVPPGKWLTGSFNLTSHLTLFLEKGAVLIGTQVLLLLFTSFWLLSFFFCWSFVCRDGSCFNIESVEI